jgi:hypothetical protein
LSVTDGAYAPAIAVVPPVASGPRTVFPTVAAVAAAIAAGQRWPFSGRHGHWICGHGAHATFARRAQALEFLCCGRAAQT